MQPLPKSPDHTVPLFPLSCAAHLRCSRIPRCSEPPALIKGSAEARARLGAKCCILPPRCFLQPPSHRTEDSAASQGRVLQQLSLPRAAKLAPESGNQDGGGEVGRQGAQECGQVCAGLLNVS